MKIIKEALTNVFDTINFAYIKLSAILTPFLTLLYLRINEFYSPVSHLFVYLFILAVLDIASGMYASIVIEKQKLSSRRFWFRKAGVFVLFMLGLTTVLTLNIFLKEFGDSLDGWIPKSWMLFYACYEAISILENISRIGYLKGVGAIINMFKKKLPDEIGQALDEAKKEEEKK